MGDESDDFAIVAMQKVPNAQGVFWAALASSKLKRLVFRLEFLGSFQDFVYVFLSRDTGANGMIVTAFGVIGQRGTP
jgi:hypothetical protein